MVDTVTISTNRPGQEPVTMTGDEFDRAAREIGARTHRVRRVSAPTESNFGDRDFLPADDLELLASDLIDRHTAFSHVPGLRVHYRWKKKGGKKSGAAVYGKCVKPSGLLADYSEADFVIWLAADYVRDAEFTQRQIEALLYHEMLHAGISGDEDDGEAKPVLIAHDFEGFRSEVEHYGWWSSELKDLQKTALQLKMFGDEPVAREHAQEEPDHSDWPEAPAPPAHFGSSGNAEDADPTRDLDWEDATRPDVSPEDVSRIRGTVEASVR